MRRIVTLVRAGLVVRVDVARPVATVRPRLTRRLTRRLALRRIGVALDRVLLVAAGQMAEHVLGLVCDRVARRRRCAFGVLLVYRGSLSVACHPCTSVSPMHVRVTHARHCTTPARSDATADPRWASACRLWSSTHADAIA